MALSATNTSVSESTLALPGINLIQSLREQSDIGVSITHCPEMVAVVIGEGKVGVDCEAVGKRRNWQGIADLFFTENEAEAIRQDGSEMTERVFLLHWTLKEAFIKANAKSIFGALNDLIVRSSTEVQFKGCGHEHWQSWNAAVGNCILGICYQGERITVPAILECTDLSSGTFISCQDTISINYMSTS